MKLIMIGALGNMLGPASKHLQNTPGIRVLRVLDRGGSSDKKEGYRAAWRTQGAQLVDSLEALVKPLDFEGVVICAGKNGDDQEIFKQLIPQLKAGQFVLHLSTVSCQFVKTTYDFCKKYQIEYANYPLTGGALGAENASMLILAGGSSELFHRLEPLLKKLGQARFLGSDIEAGAVTKLIGHVLVFTGLVSISSAVSLQARCEHQRHTFPEQVSLFDFLNQGAGGTRQWDVALKNGVQHNDWKKGFLLKHAAVDLIYLLELMIEKNQFSTSKNILFELAYSFAFLLQEGLQDDATQVLVQYWLEEEKSSRLKNFLGAYYDAKKSDLEKLLGCVNLFPEGLRETVLLEVRY